MSEVRPFLMRAPADWIADVDGWRVAQSGCPSRAEAVRRLVAAALAMSDTGDTAARGDTADTGDTGDTAFGHDPLCDVTPEEMRAFLN